MAGASMNDIKARIKSVNSTMQITKAMELVAISKLRRAKERAESSRPYGDALAEVVGSLAEKLLSETPFGSSESTATLYIVIAGDRGLAGGYNANVFRALSGVISEGDIVLPIGKKAQDHVRHRGYATADGVLRVAGEMSVGDCLNVSSLILELYREGRIGRVKLIYTHFTSMMSQTVRSVELLPIAATEQSSPEPLFDGDIEELVSTLLPQYLGGRLYSALCESVASEQGARRMAMNAANKNAGEMIDELMLGYNRARQAVITQEITEIVSGAEAL